MLKLSIIIAIFNRSNELKTLLASLKQQNCKDFEVIVVDDGSSDDLKSVAEQFKPELDLFYYKKKNSGPGLSRNYGVGKANGNYYIFLDSDTIVPNHYTCAIIQALENNYVDFFGGSDASHQDFTALQKAINFSMTSFLTTGGIRGGKKKVNKFQPRSFNMGLSKEAFDSVGGFSDLRVGEDPDLTLSLWEKGFKSQWFPDAYVYHQRRTSIKKFGEQVKAFGIARPILNSRHPKYVSFTFWFPTIFIIGFTLSLLLLLLGVWQLFAVFMIYFLFIFMISSFQNKSIKIGILSCLTTFIQFEMYGMGFLRAQIMLNVLGKNPKEAFPKHFYQS